MKRIDFYAFLFVSHLFFRKFFLSLVRYIIAFFCFKGATLSSASLQTFINELKEVSLEFCKFPLFVLIIDLKSLFENFLQSRYIITLGSAFMKYDLSTVTVILWKSGNLVSILKTVSPINEHEIYKFWIIRTFITRWFFY